MRRMRPLSEGTAAAPSCISASRVPFLSVLREASLPAWWAGRRNTIDAFVDSVRSTVGWPSAEVTKGNIVGK